MLPTFEASMNVIIEESISPRLRPPNLQRGDVITFLKPTQREISVCKRIIGLPGDVMCIDPTGPEPWRHLTVPTGHVWVQGDNAPHSTDSRVYGPVPMGLIKGKILMTVRPAPNDAHSQLDVLSHLSFILAWVSFIATYSILTEIQLIDVVAEPATMVH